MSSRESLQQATTPAYIASGHHVHEAIVRGGLWTARCDWSAGWQVPLIADPEAVVVFVTCPKCREKCGRRRDDT